MRKQELRNALSDIEDEARRRRNAANIHQPEEEAAFALIVRLTQLVREEIVR